MSANRWTGPRCRSVWAGSAGPALPMEPGLYNVRLTMDGKIDRTEVVVRAGLWKRRFAESVRGSFAVYTTASECDRRTRDGDHR